MEILKYNWLSEYLTIKYDNTYLLASVTPIDMNNIIVVEGMPDGIPALSQVKSVYLHNSGHMYNITRSNGTIHNMYKYLPHIHDINKCVLFLVGRMHVTLDVPGSSLSKLF